MAHALRLDRPQLEPESRREAVRTNTIRAWALVTLLAVASTIAFSSSASAAWFRGGSYSGYSPYSSSYYAPTWTPYSGYSSYSPYYGGYSSYSPYYGGYSSYSPYYGGYSSYYPGYTYSSGYTYGSPGYVYSSSYYPSYSYRTGPFMFR